ncbi:5-oxoprolinase subunit PxpB [Paraglaciecola sp. L3A3]|uniref:5-oxoprolinase subunit PxpB n=1 Tax=Paraglaciecola sp. L3A3 TaxID=2686358 RepID=UPI00131C33DA|nr:5-oxoprolinase subunit PxpB [Paraglaciecola sp. L3A3]
MKNIKVSLLANGDSGLSLLFDEPISQRLSRKIISLANICQIQFSDKLEQIIPAYQSLTLHYYPAKISFTDLSNELNSLLQHPLPEVNYQAKQVIIPVCYEQPFSLNLDKVAEHNNLSVQHVIQLHSETEYFVHMLGFSPGFLYLGGLPPQLTCARKSSPDLSVPAGSVGIGGSQTGIYPQNSPGGWQIIGRTPIPLFNIRQPQPCVAQPLDTVKFKPICAAEFEQISNQYL